MNFQLLRKSKVLQAVQRVAREQGIEVYLVGGAVRDFLLGKGLGKDLDLAAPGGMQNLAQSVARETGGHAFLLDSQFGTWRVTLRRKEKTEVDLCSLQGENIYTDLGQRDFTVNSMAFSLKDIFSREDPCVIDPRNGLADLRQGILRANAEESLLQDPLRMLRAFRFALTHGLKPEDQTLGWIRKNKALVRQAAGERVRGELFAALDLRKGGAFFRSLQGPGLLAEIFPETGDWEGIDLGPPEPMSLLDHACRTVEMGEFLLEHLNRVSPPWDNALLQHFAETVEEGVSRKALFKLICFFHDSGKPRVRQIDPNTLTTRFFDHDQEGQKINTEIARRLKLSRKSVRILGEVTRHHMRLLSLAKGGALTPRAKYRFFRDLGKEGIESALLALANRLGRQRIDPAALPGGGPGEEIEKVRAAAGEVLRYYFEEFRPRPLLDGKEVMKVLRIPEGEIVGRVLNALKDAEVAGKVSTREEALEFIKNIDISRPLV